MTRLSALLRQAGVRPLAAVGTDPEIRAAAIDSRQIGPGDLFVAIRGFAADGESYVGEAIRRGAPAVVAGSPRPAGVDARVGWVQVEDPRLAAALLAREARGRPDEALALVGVTGTNGKTTVTYLVEAIGRAAGRRCGRIGTLGHAVDGAEQPSARTTPEAPELYRLLAEMREGGVELVAIEVSSHALALHRVGGARFAVAAFLNVGHDHLDFHSDERAYFETKARLFESLPGDARAVLPADTAHGRELARRTPGRVLSFGRGPGAQVRLRDERCSLTGSSAVLETPAGRLPIRTFLLGGYNLDNAAAAAACALALGLPPESIPAGVLALKSVPGRTEPVDCGQPFLVLVDYAHTPDALARVLDWVRDAGRGRSIVVFGCGGGRDRDKRPRMGRVAAERADLVVLTSDNPRDEDPLAILREVAGGAAAAGGAGAPAEVVADRREAIRRALGAASAGDIVVVAGKGHETEQVLGSESRPFDDRRVVREVLGELGWGARRARP